MDKPLRNTLIVGIILIGISVAYYFVARPILNEKKLANCLQEANKYLNEARKNKEGDDTEGLKKIGNIYGENTEQERTYLRERAAFDEIQKRAEEAEKECFMKYPQK